MNEELIKEFTYNKEEKMGTRGAPNPRPKPKPLSKYRSDVMKKKQIKFVAVDEFENICGPVGDSEAFVKKALITGYRGTGPTPWVKEDKSDTQLWHEIVEMGYTIKKAKMTIID